MNQRTLVFCCLLLSVSAARQKDQRKITLEDIEQDNSLKRTKQAVPKVAIPAKSPTQYGFIPTKTLNDYIRNEPKVTYFGSQRPLAHAARPATGKATANRQKYHHQQTFQYTASPQLSVQPDKYAVPQQAYTVNFAPENQNQYQQYEGVQYVAENSILPGGQSSEQQQPHQQYYGTQYVYLQQYPSPSTAVQNVVDPKGGVQYVMYVPVTDQSQKYSNLAYTDDTSSSQQQPTYQKDTSYQTPVTYQSQQQVPTVYDTQSEVQVSSYTPTAQQSSQYIPAKYIKNDNIYKREPKSLLDSYVPSYLQLQYYNQVQQNAIRDTVKVPHVFTTKDYAAEQSVVSSRYSPLGATSYVNYRPSTYRQ